MFNTWFELMLFAFGWPLWLVIAKLFGLQNLQYSWEMAMVRICGAFAILSVIGMLVWAGSHVRIEWR